MTSSTKGYLLGLVGIVMFSMTLPATKVAVLEMTPDFIAFGRALVAGLLALIVLIARNAIRPSRSQWPWIALAAFGVVFGFPYFSTQALRGMSASHGAIITGLLPLATAACAVVLNRERPAKIFWIWAVLGSAIVIGFALLSNSDGFKANFAMFAAIILGAIGYAAGARLSANLGGINTICWALVLSLPINAILVYLTTIPPATTSPQAWLAFAYISVFSMFVGFFFWYNGLAIGGVAKVGQMQLLQPFFTITFANLVNKEPFELRTLLVGLLVVFVVMMGRRSTVKK
jgi:drug/metabolite transporter (DMT)-like permease